MSNILGLNVWYTLHEMRLAQPLVEDALKQHGFDLNYIRVPTARRAFGKAMRDHNDLRHGVFARPIGGQGAELAFGIVRESSDEVQVALDYKQVTVAKFDKAAKVARAEGEMAESVMASYSGHLEGYDQTDIRHFLRYLIWKCAGVPKRPSGGIYFIPANYEGALREAQAFLQQLGFGTLYVERVYDGTEERGNVWTAVEAEVGKLLDGVMERISGVQKRVRSAQKALPEVEALRALTSTYTELLGEQAKAEALTARFEEAATAVAAKVKELQEAKLTVAPAAEPAPAESLPVASPAA